MNDLHLAKERVRGLRLAPLVSFPRSLRWMSFLGTKEDRGRLFRFLAKVGYLERAKLPDLRVPAHGLSDLGGVPALGQHLLGGESQDETEAAVKTR